MRETSLAVFSNVIFKRKYNCLENKPASDRSPTKRLANFSLTIKNIVLKVVIINTDFIPVPGLV